MKLFSDLTQLKLEFGQIRHKNNLVRIKRNTEKMLTSRNKLMFC